MILRILEFKVSVISRRLTTLCKTKIILDSTNWIIVLLHKELRSQYINFKFVSETKLTLDLPSLFSIIFVVGHFLNSFLTVLITSMGFCGFSATHWSTAVGNAMETRNLTNRRLRLQSGRPQSILFHWLICVTDRFSGLRIINLVHQIFLSFPVNIFLL